MPRGVCLPKIRIQNSTKFATLYAEGDLIRIVTAAAEYPFEFSIDEHYLHVHELDGFPINTMKSDALILNPGETALVSVERQNDFDQGYKF